MDMLKKTVTLNDGNKIPVIGLGTWQTPASIACRVVKEGIEVGYRHIDTASAYYNEEEVGRGIKESGIARKDIYVTTKIRAELKTYEEARDQIQDSLKKLGTGYIDLMLIHCPTPWDEYGPGRKDYFKENLAVYKAMEEAYERGEIKSLGVSNFNIADVKNILSHCKVKPVVNQIPWFIGERQEELKQYCHDHGILIESYSPLGTGRLLSSPLVKMMAEKYHVTPAQLCIRFALLDADITLPKTTHKEYMITNSQVDFEISNEDLEIMKQAKKGWDYWED